MGPADRISDSTFPLPPARPRPNLHTSAYLPRSRLLSRLPSRRQEIAVDSHSKIEKLMEQGNEMRAVASTQMNATSSRSHSIFIIKLQQKEV